VEYDVNAKRVEGFEGVLTLRKFRSMASLTDVVL
jgi:hypothetical protein